MISLIMPYYDNPGMLKGHYGEWSRWPEKLRAEYKFIIVDDGSPNSPAVEVTRPTGLCDIEIYRVLEDRPWHQHGARNLGAHVAPEGWLLLTDMDHVLERGPADGLVYRTRYRQPPLNPSAAFMFARIEADTRQPTRNDRGEPKPHPNSFLMTRDLYWQVGGYDENYCGIYGTDSLFRKRLPAITHLDVPLIRYSRDMGAADASTRTLPRKDQPNRAQLRAAVAAKNLPIKTLDFPWRREC